VAPHRPSLTPETKNSPDCDPDSRRDSHHFLEAERGKTEEAEDLDRETSRNSQRHGGRERHRSAFECRHHDDAWHTNVKEKIRAVRNYGREFITARARHHELDATEHRERSHPRRARFKARRPAMDAAGHLIHGSYLGWLGSVQ
jgi:hypothetical protein